MSVLFMLFHILMFLDSQIREKLSQLQEKRDKINKKWQDKMDYLQIGMGDKKCFTICIKVHFTS